jgi:hypothetical protein
MSTAELKTYLHGCIDSTSNESTLKIIASIFSDGDWWGTLPESVKTSITKAKEESKQGLGVSHDALKEKYAKWL